MTKRIAIFASGNGSNFEALAKACRDGVIKAEVALCVTDKPGAYVEKRAEKYGVEVLAFNPKEFATKACYEEMLVKRLKEEKIDLVCLAGYMRIIGPTLLDSFRNRIINIHPSLLPAFPGVDAIGQALDYGVKIFGVTIHYVDETLDGGKIISQAAIPYEGNSREELEPLVHAQEHILYVDTVSNLLKGQ